MLNPLPDLDSASVRVGPSGHVSHEQARVSLGRRMWLAVSGAFAAVLGIAPHVLHHAGPLAGAALLGGVAGSLLFGLLGFLLAIPLLVRLRRRFGSWRVPAAALAVFVAVFSLSTFVIGPALSGSDEQSSSSTSPQNPNASPASQPSHEEHHQ